MGYNRAVLLAEPVMRLCPSYLLLILVVVVLGTASLLTGCGKRGPLYLPDEAPRQTAPTPER